MNHLDPLDCAATPPSPASPSEPTPCEVVPSEVVPHSPRVSRRGFVGRALMGVAGGALAGVPALAQRAGDSRRANDLVEAGLDRAAREVRENEPARTAADFWPERARPSLVCALEDSASRPHLHPALWPNRFQDWRLHGGRIEPLNTGERDGIYTVNWLTRDYSGTGEAFLSVRLAPLSRGEGFAGLMFGIGSGRLEPLQIAYVSRVSGEGGGLMAVLDADGSVAFREHLNETSQRAYGVLPGRDLVASAPAPAPGEEIELRLWLARLGEGVRMRLSAWSARDGRFLRGVERFEPRAGLLEGGISLAALPRGDSGALWSFADLRAGGDGVRADSSRAIGPISGVLYSLDCSRGDQNAIWKLTAQLLPLAPIDADGAAWRARQSVVLRARRAGEERWTPLASAPLERGFNALFRVEGFDATRAWEWQVVWNDATFEGTISPVPRAGQEMRMAVGGCFMHTGRHFEAGPYRVELPGEKFVGRFTPECFNFPHSPIRAGMEALRPHLLLFNGDQFYENNPSREDLSEDPLLDYLYKWHLFVLSFRDIMAHVPTIVQIDDHDVYHGNIWGAGGIRAPQSDEEAGGYEKAVHWVNTVESTQCGHNPDPFDPTPLPSGIGVYYAAFVFGGVSFALLEDRKWKSPPLADRKTQPDDGELLGPRQEAFLEAWAAMHPGLPKMALTQSTLATLYTEPDGAARPDPDSNGAPRKGRERAVELLHRAGALIVSGDQHLPHLCRHLRPGAAHLPDGPKAGPLQFTCPAGATSFMRWFEPAGRLDNAGSTPFTGDWTDHNGNRIRCLAVGNPPISHATLRAHKERGQSTPDRTLRNDGFALVALESSRAPGPRFWRLECFPFDAVLEGGIQFAGWPHREPVDTPRLAS